MKHSVFFVFLLAVLCGFPPSSMAQNTNAGTGNPAITGSLDSQFFHLNRISRNQEGFKLIRRGNLDFIQKNVLDSIRIYQSDITQKTEEISGLQERVTQLTDSLQTAHRELLVAEEESQMVQFLGMSLSLGVYHLFVWIVIVVLLIALIVILIRFRQHSVNSRDARDSLGSIQEEFDTFRKKSLEKEQKLKRQLQDEINKGNA